jgi:surface antigen
LGGAVVGSMTGHGEVLPTLIGAGIGGVGGYIVGNEMDKYDRKQVTQTLETTPSGETTKWTNPDTGKTFQATPQPAKTEVVDGDKKITRDIKLESYVDGEKKLVTAKAYRNDDGQWVLN